MPNVSDDIRINFQDPKKGIWENVTPSNWQCRRFLDMWQTTCLCDIVMPCLTTPAMNEPFHGDMGDQSSARWNEALVIKQRGWNRDQRTPSASRWHLPLSGRPKLVKKGRWSAGHIGYAYFRCPNAPKGDSVCQQAICTDGHITRTAERFAFRNAFRVAAMKNSWVQQLSIFIRQISSRATSKLAESGTDIKYHTTAAS